ncbi:MAG TPA: hypothetical protein VFG69_15510, partial [Nannocystaceae bacterium]|nr:hypothetical protein [Nannocystaceae bacterium]
MRRVTLTGGARGDTKTVEQTLTEADQSLQDVRDKADEAHRAADPRVRRRQALPQQRRADLARRAQAPQLRVGAGTRSSELGDKHDERDAVSRNRSHVRGERGKALLLSRGELLERPFAHALETGG